MFITMEKFRAQPADSRHRRLNCFVGNPETGRMSTTVKCNGFWLILSVTTAPRREGEAPQIDLADFMSRLYEGVPLIRIPRNNPGLQLPEHIHASPKDFDSLYSAGQFLWTISPQDGHQEGALEELISMGLRSETHPSIIFVDLEAAVWLATEYAPGRTNCFYFESPPSDKPETTDLRLKAEESLVPFIFLPGDLPPWGKAVFIKKTVKSGAQPQSPQ